MLPKASAEKGPGSFLGHIPGRCRDRNRNRNSELGQLGVSITTTTTATLITTTRSGARTGTNARTILNHARKSDGDSRCSRYTSENTQTDMGRPEWAAI